MIVKRILRAGLVLALVPVAVPAGAAAADPGDGPPRQVAQRGAALSADPAGEVTRPARSTGRPYVGKRPVWPSGSTELDLSAPGRGGIEGVTVTPVGPAAGARVAGESPGRVQLHVTPGTATEGTLSLRLTPLASDGDGGRAGGTVRVAVDYTSFRDAYGADWSTRLALTGPGAGGSRNNVRAGTVTADVALPAGGTTLALEAAESGPAGDYAATPVQPAGTWTAGGNSGDFRWSYDLRVPPAMNGPEPDLALSYSSGSVDGRMAASNNQPSWVGEGFEFSVGSIERRYVPCAKDMAGSATNQTKTGDLCWRRDNATLTLNGRTTELIKGPGDRWHSRTEDGSRIEKKTGLTHNGDADGEHWVVTTPDGTQYWFGRNRLPGWASGRTETKSVWTVPVFGNHNHEPCYNATFASGSCAQAWRWNLDYVQDPFGNTMSFWYEREDNAYAQNNTRTKVVGYTRGGWLDRIDYGTRSDTAYGTAPMQVDFDETDRCVTASCGTKNKTNWPDTPWDLNCAGASTCERGSPTFWSAKRLRTVTTKVRKGSAYQNVDSWTLTHSFPDPGDGTRAGLWLGQIRRSGLAGTREDLPAVRFTGVQLNNRVDAVDHAPAMNWWRLAYVESETGGSTNVSYSAHDCVRGSRMPDKDSLHNNALRCFPVKWTPSGYTDPVLDYFHKYVVTTVTESDNGLPSDARAVRAITTYQYLGSPAWRYTDDDGLVEDELKTWSVWRGYGRVQTTTGEGADASRTEATYFRGLHGDKVPGGTRSVELPAAGGAPAATDHDEFAGMPREEKVFDGAAEVGAVVHTPWRSDPTATRTIDGVTVTARFVGDAEVRTRTALDQGRGWRRTTERTTFDAYGKPIREEDLGDDDVGDDQRCTITDYARNTTAWLMEHPVREREFAVDCIRAQQPGLAEADVISDTYTRYDGGARGAAPSKGGVTAVETLAGWPSRYLTESTAVLDAHGRATSSTDARGVTTTTTFTPATGGPVTAERRVRRINGVDWVETEALDPAWGVATEQTDVNGKVTRQRYDALGRLTGVWRPNRIGKTANVTFAYAVRATGGTAVATSVLHPDGERYLTSYAFHDSLGRERQTQTPEGTAAGGRIVTDTQYDTAGRPYKVSGPQVYDGAPRDVLEKPKPDAEYYAQTVTEYDGAGREKSETFRSRGEMRWRTKTDYGGDRVDRTPAQGEFPSSIWTDARGNTVLLRQYHTTTIGGSAYTDTTYRYNRKGLLDQVRDTAGNTWTYGYDLLGRRTSTDDPDQGRSTATYTDQGDVRSTTNAEGQTLWTDYDVLGRRTAVRDGSATGRVRAEWAYDAIGTTRWLGQKVKSTRYESTAQGTAAYVDAIGGFTDLYQPTSRTVTIPAAETGLAGSYSYVYGFTDGGAPATTRLPAVGGLPQETLILAYDPTGREKTLKTSVSTTGEDEFLVNGTSYTRYGDLALIGRRSGAGKWLDTGYTYEEGTRRLTRVLTTRETTPSLVADVRYERDPAGNVTAIRDVASGDHQCFAHDHAQRLVQAWTPAAGDCAAARSQAALGGPAAYWHSFEYDAVGNRTRSVERTATASVERRYTYPAAGARQPHALQSMQTVGGGTATYTYDKAGRTRTRPADGLAGSGQTLAWDPEHHLATSADAGGQESYVYDAEGNRLVRREGGARTLYLPDQELHVAAPGQAADGKRFIPYAGQVVAVRSVRGLDWQVSDHQGTAQVSVRASDQAVTLRRQTPFGGERGPAVAWPTERGFVNGTKDAGTGLTHIGAREYDPLIGRFVSVDPVIDVNDPDQMHGYNYADASPLTYSDPDGLMRRNDIDGRGSTYPTMNPKPREHMGRPRDRLERDDIDRHYNRPRKCTYQNPCTTRRPTWRPAEQDWFNPRRCRQGSYCRLDSGWTYNWRTCQRFACAGKDGQLRRNGLPGWECHRINGCVVYKPPPPPKPAPKYRKPMPKRYTTFAGDLCVSGGYVCIGFALGETTKGGVRAQVSLSGGFDSGEPGGTSLNLAVANVGAERVGRADMACGTARYVEACGLGGRTTDTGQRWDGWMLGTGTAHGGGVGLGTQKTWCVAGCDGPSDLPAWLDPHK